MSDSYAGSHSSNANVLAAPERAALSRQLRAGRLREYLQFDSPLASSVTAWGALGVAASLAVIGRNRRALDWLSVAHRSSQSQVTQHIVETILKQPRASAIGARVNEAYDRFLASLSAEEKHRRPENLLGTRLLVVKSPAPRERGVIIIDYTYAFPIFARYCDLAELAKKYYIVLEPSWVGYCVPEILVYSRLADPVFVETNEPPDQAFLQRVSPNFVPVPVVANWWIDYRLIRPVPGVSKDSDLSMVASWTRFKRHAALFAALQRLRKRGVKLRAVLIGYPVDGTLTRDDIYRQAKYFDVADQVEIYEHLTPPQVAEQLSRTKAHVLWSRREGCNRAIIEAMLTDVPVILRSGFNFGHDYPYINAKTGRFADEDTLPAALLEMSEQHAQYSPRAWVMENMTPQIATHVLNDHIKRIALSRTEAWTSDIVVKTAQLNSATYWDPADKDRFKDDYAFLRSLCATGQVS